MIKIICSYCGNELEPLLKVDGDIKVYECTNKECTKKVELIGNKQVKYS